MISSFYLAGRCARPGPLRTPEQQRLLGNELVRRGVEAAQSCTTRKGTLEDKFLSLVSGGGATTPVAAAGGAS